MERIFPRDCFVCGKPMTLLKDTKWLECWDCELAEDGTINGRFTSFNVEELEWEGKPVSLIDHSKVHLPSPDVTGNICVLVPRGV